MTRGGEGGNRGGKYFGSEIQQGGEMMSGVVEGTEMMYFTQTNSIEDILNIIQSLPEGALRNSKGQLIDKRTCLNTVASVKDFVEGDQLVPNFLLGEITGQQGLRPAVIREIIKSRESEQFFEKTRNLDQIVRNLESILAQNNILDKFQSGTIVLRDSSGQPVNIQRYIDDLKYIKDWMMYNQNQLVPNDFYMRFTGNNGIREAVMRATGR